MGWVFASRLGQARASPAVAVNHRRHVLDKVIGSDSALDEVLGNGYQDKCVAVNCRPQ